MAHKVLWDLVQVLWVILVKSSPAPSKGLLRERMPKTTRRGCAFDVLGFELSPNLALCAVCPWHVTSLWDSVSLLGKLSYTNHCAGMLGWIQLIQWCWVDAAACLKLSIKRSRTCFCIGQYLKYLLQWHAWWFCSTLKRHFMTLKDLMGEVHFCFS